MSLRLWRGRRSGHHSFSVRPQQQWKQIFNEQTDGTAHEAAARILGDLYCYSAERGNLPRSQFFADVEQLANALEAWRLP